MSARAALPTELPAIVSFVGEATRAPDGLVGSIMPAQLVEGALVGWQKLMPGLVGIGSRIRTYVEHHRGELRAVAIVYHGRRPEWVVLLLASAGGPDGSDGAFRLVSQVCAMAAQRGMHRVFSAVPDETRACETLFQTGFYSYTRETWLTHSGALREPSRQLTGRIAGAADAHDLFRFYASTTPHAVQRAEQLTVEDFDVGRRAGAFDSPHVGGNPVAMRRQLAVMLGDESRPRAVGMGYRGVERHPHVCKVRTADVDVDLARELMRSVALDLGGDRPIATPVRSYEEHVARAAALEGFREAATTMLFVKELAIRIEEPAFATVPARSS